MKPRRVPRELREPPVLDAGVSPQSPAPRHALVVNPFYPKDPHASFGKHVLTPTLALTSLAGATPPGWTVRLWDENLLQGPPPWRPFPQVVGITVHLTFANRAFELARWFRERGALVVLGGLHVLSCPEECAPHPDALAIGEGVQLWPAILRDAESGLLAPRYAGGWRTDFRDEPPPARHLSPEQLADGYAWCYERCFSLASLWRRRPGNAEAVLPYLAMSYLLTRSQTRSGCT